MCTVDYVASDGLAVHDVLWYMTHPIVACRFFRAGFAPPIAPSFCTGYTSQLASYSPAEDAVNL